MRSSSHGERRPVVGSRLPMAVAAAFCVMVLAIVGWGELEHWRASRRGLPARGPKRGGRSVVVVLGYRNPGNRANAVNRWRIRAGLRSLDPGRGGSELVLCGGPTTGGRSEAELMAEYARDSRGYTGRLVLEAESRTTRENIRNLIPLIEDAGRIKIVSNPLHAEKARNYLRLERPDLAERLVRAEDYRLGEWILIKPLLVLRGGRRPRRSPGG